VERIKYPAVSIAWYVCRYKMPIVKLRGTIYGSRERAELSLPDIFEKHPLARCGIVERKLGFVIAVHVNGLRGYWREPFKPVLLIAFLILLALMLLADRLDLKYGAHANPDEICATCEGVP
jgi:hypothetical protein